jgi:TonB family protein
MTAGALLTFTVALAAAQTGPVTFSGSVFDSTGAPVPGATVVLTNTQTKAKFEVTSGDFGQFTFVPLPADTYALATSLPGFKKAEDSVTLTGKTVKRDVRLSLGELQETITVRASSAVSGGVAGGVSGGIPTRQYDRTGFQKELESCQASSTGGRVRPPRKIKDVRPIYPANLRESQTSGKVGLKATIAVDGTVRDVQVVKSVHPDLDNAAIEAVRQWLFDGTLLNCAPVEVTMNVSIDFGVQ